MNIFNLKKLNIKQIIIKKNNRMNKTNSLSQYQAKNNLQPQRINLFSQLSQSTAVSKSTHISSIIQCLICEESIRQAHMCPSCCKLFCQNCIKSWIRNKKPECPNVNCQKFLNNNNLLNCSILGRQIEQALSKSVSKIKSPMSSSVMLSPSGTKIVFPKPTTPIYESPPAPKSTDIMCNKHQLKLDYYCQQCLIGLCADCAVLTSNHHGHKLCKFSQKKMKYMQSVSKIQDRIAEAKNKLLCKKNDTILWLQKLKIIQNQKKTNLIAYLNHIFQKNIQNHNKLIKIREQNFDVLQQSYQKLQNSFQILQHQFEQKSKSKLVTQYQKMRFNIQQSLQNLTNKQNIQFIRAQNQLLPEFQQKIYILENYDQLRQKGQILISQPLYSKGTQWRLKIFPGGINPKFQLGQDKYLAIHLQMSKGHQHINWYRYRIELVNQANRCKCMSFQFQNDFKQGSEWCLDKFIRISSLYSQNFIHPTQGYIQIILYIRCLSYYHAIKDQNQFITIKQQILCQNKQIIQNLNRKAQERGIKIQKKNNSMSRKDSCVRFLQNNQLPKVMAID